MDLQILLADNPKFHTMGSGEAASYRLSPAVLSYIAGKVGPESRTLETGAGVSTVWFASLGTHHTCITPSKEEVDRIVEYCEERKITLEKVHFVIERSETAMPRLNVDGLDLVLVDGNHSFPGPFIDYYYAVERMKVGGLLIVDDTQLWTGRVLRDFLLLEPEWQLDREFFRRTTSFIKVKEGSHLKWWAMQPYVKKHSSRYIFAYRMRAAWRVLKSRRS